MITEIIEQNTNPDLPRFLVNHINYGEYEYKQQFSLASLNYIKDINELYFNIIQQPHNTSTLCNEFFIKTAIQKRDATTEDFYIPNNDKNIQCRRYSNDTNADTVVLFFHGGGFVNGNLDTHDNIARELAFACKSDVIAVNYSLAPQYQYPYQIQEVVAAYKWLIENTKYKKIILSGDSAGGTFCTELRIKIAALSLRESDAQILFYPGLGVELTSESCALYSTCSALHLNAYCYSIMKYTGKSYEDIMLELSNGTDVLYKNQPSIFKNTIIFAPECDILTSTTMMGAAQTEGDCQFYILRGAVHGFLSSQFQDSVNYIMSIISQWAAKLHTS